MLTTKEKGDISTAAILLAFLKNKIPTSIPWGDNLRYDLIIELNNKLYKVQCKTARKHNTSLKFNISSSYSQGSRVKENRQYNNDVDYFAVYYPDNNQVYLIPIKEVKNNKFSIMLSVSKPKNNQKKSIRKAEKYKI